MALKTHPLYTDFTGGELGGITAGRLDLPRYAKGVQLMENFIVLRQGPADRRAGMRFVAYAKYDDDSCNLIPFVYSATQAYILEVGDLYFRFFMDGYRIGEATGATLVTNGTFPAGIAGWTNLSVAPGTIAWSVNHMNLTGTVVAPGVAQQGIATVVGTEYRLRFLATGNNLKCRIGKTSGGSEVLPITNYTHGAHVWEVYFTAKSLTTYIQFISNAGVTAELDNVDLFVWAPVEILTSPYETVDLPDLVYEQTNNYLYICDGSRLPYKLTRSSHTAWTLAVIDPEDGPYLDKVAEPQVRASATSGVGTTVTLRTNNQIVNGDFPSDILLWTDLSTGTGSIGWNAGGKIDIAGGAAGVGWVEQQDLCVVGNQYRVKLDVETTDAKIRIGSASGLDDILADTTVPIGLANIITFTANFSQVFIQFRQTANATSTLDNIENRCLLWVSGQVGAYWRLDEGTNWGYGKITVRTDGTQISVLVKKAFHSTGNCDYYREGAWSTYRGFPACVCLHENRMLYAHTSSSPSTIWASKSGTYEDYDNFTPGTGDADPWTFTIPSSAIRWLKSRTALIIGTMSGIHRMTGDPMITPTNVERREEGTQRASTIQPLKVGGSIIFTEWAEKSLLEMTYKWEEDAYVAPDMSILAPHLLEHGIRALAFQQTPQPVIWVLLEDRDLLAVCYERLQDTVVAWTRVHTEGDIDSIAIIPDEITKEDQLWLATKRTINGTEKRLIELMDPTINVDCGLTYIGPATSVIGGLDHLVGETVKVVGDLILMEDKTVDVNGQITLDQECEEVEAGKGFESILVTNTLEVPTSSGTSMGQKKRWVEIFVMLYETQGVTINGEQVWWRTGDDPFDEATQTFTGLKKVTNLGHGYDVKLVIEQRNPLPCTVLAIFGTVEVGG